ncbi:hypothetical protein MUK51_10950 [Sphingobacterium faecium]|uniref:hypothetical protein n=1 Tax=Sphingobacterium faecium TaxID=34087 RepID=UPI0021B67E36|nr:hypothetical protein [Sphingobacterium faecium]UXD67745.1 hypothetical protein MUK51_10950 [Sphingobacterium faecium]
MKDQKNKLTDLLQEYVNDQFDKRLPIKFDDEIYDIAIRQDQIPTIKNIVDKNNYYLIKMNEFISEEFDDLLLRNSIGELDALKIDKKYLINTSKTYKLFKDLMLNNENLPEGNKIELLIKHKDKRFIHAVSSFLSELKANLNKNDKEIGELLKG